MTSASSPSSSPALPWKAKLATVIESISDAPDHPVQIALRTYSLCLSLSLGPVLLPVIFAPALHPKSLEARARVFWRTLSRELRPTGFALAITAAVGGGAALQRLWDFPERPYTHPVHYIHSKLTLCQRAFLANVITSTLAVTLLRWRRRRRLGTASPTLDLSLLFLVRALDALVQAFLLQKARETAARALPRDGVAPQPSGLPSTPPDTRLLDMQYKDLAKEWQRKVATHLDVLVFWASSARFVTVHLTVSAVFGTFTLPPRIMWCFFYQPQRLPPSYVKWISSLANVDKGFLEIIRALREGTWSYIHGSSPKRNILGPLVEELGRPPSWGDPAVLPAYGGDFANEAWKQLGVDGRIGVGGLPCELLHGGIGARFGSHNSCVSNAALRAIYAFVEAFVIYLPVHFLPILLTKPSSIMRPHRALPTLLSAIRSATFLSTFVSSCWFAVCFTRTLVLARLFPKISHDVWDGPYGCTLAGSLVCGASIWIENARRRGEMALYVLPKALRASISEKWLRSGHPVVQFAECLTFILSLASLLTFSVHQPESLRGLSRWTLAFVVKGPNAGFWKKRKREIATCPPTPADSSIPALTDSGYHED
ncbi:hypothetical protein J3R82DRAFT_784 [Butyriboletus roseoflavus]|nr:hypothetical protein J3R82DRAFT_784 [Butyriboletus roseoflavus]